MAPTFANEFFFRFKYKQISNLMGDTNSSTYITMIRNPVDIFVSAWEYYKLGGSYKMTLGNFIQNNNIQMIPSR